MIKIQEILEEILKRIAYNVLLESKSKYSIKHAESRYILSIGIPTYGSPQSVKQNIRHLLELDRDDVEIIVVDNDVTGEQIKEDMLKISDKRFRYYQNEKNIGRSNNIIKVIEKAAAQFVFLVSSDDYIELDCIDKIIDTLKKHPNCSMITGSHKGDKGGYIYQNLRNKIVKGGEKSVLAWEWNGNLRPTVYNKMYLNIESLYGISETYMASRLSLYEHLRGDVIRLTDVFSTAKEYAVPEDNEAISLYIDDEDDIWNIGKSYADPLSRVNQLQGYFRIVEAEVKNNSTIQKFMRKHISRECFLELHRYTIMSHDTEMLKLRCASEKLNYLESIEAFKNSMMRYFETSDRIKKYDCLSHIWRRYNVEIMHCRFADRIIDMLKKKNIYIYYADEKGKNLIKILKFMGVTVKGALVGKGDYHIPVVKLSQIRDGLVLVTSTRWRDIEPYWFISYRIRTFADVEMAFMPNMGSYLLSAWLSRPENDDVYCKFSKEGINYLSM